MELSLFFYNIPVINFLKLHCSGRFTICSVGTLGKRFEVVCDNAALSYTALFVDTGTGFSLSEHLGEV